MTYSVTIQFSAVAPTPDVVKTAVVNALVEADLAFASHVEVTIEQLVDETAAATACDA